MSMKRGWLFLLLGLVCGGAARAEDIELFTVPPSNAGASVNVLFVVDNSANWNSSLGSSDKKTLEKQALTELLGSETSPFIGKLRVGIMSFANGNTPNGAKVIAAVDELTQARTSELNKVINADDHASYPGLTKSNNAPYALSLHEAYLYFKGLEPYAGVQDTGEYDTDAVGAGGDYIAPGAGQSCASNYVVFIGNGSPDSGEDHDAEDLLRALGGVQPSDPIPLSPHQNQSNWADEYARLLFNHGVQTYVLDVYDPSERQNNPWLSARALLKSMASKGAGVSGTTGADHYYPVTSGEELLLALTEILNKIQAVNSVFAATALPVSVNVRGTYLNQVYMGVFRPDADLRPLWRGNLKQYKLSQAADGSLYLSDANSAAVQDTQTGFVQSSATSVWTHASEFFQHIPQGDGGGSDAPDGEIVEKGGVGQALRDRHPTRTLYTCTGSCTAGSALSAFHSSSISTSALNAASSTERDDIIAWMNGLENRADENGDGALSGARVSVHADVLHSEPAVVNYDNDHEIVVYYGTNDGVFHAVRGGVSDTFNDGTGSGDELWGFVPSEYFPQLKTLRDNQTMSSVTQKPYAADGAVSVMASDGVVHVFFAQRRGGRFLYALDVTDPTSPKFRWKRSSTDWPELGQTWSKPSAVKIAYGDGVKDVLIFGAGYDEAANDALPAGTATMGRGIFVVDARSGDLLFEAGAAPSAGTVRKTVSQMTYSIASDVTPINRDNDSKSLTDRVYVGDTGGQIWRLDLNSGDPNHWVVHRIAALGADQKFLYSPDVVYGEGYDAILIGSGDREHPFDVSVANSFYMVKDLVTNPAIAPAGTVPLRTKSDLHDATGDLSEGAVPATAAGWFFNLGTGEKTVSSALTASGTTYFSTNQPSEADPNSCANLGTARIYKVSYLDGTSQTESGLTRSDTVEGGGYIPSPTYGIVDLAEGEDSALVEAVIMGTNVETPPQSNFNRRVPSYWFRHGAD